MGKERTVSSRKRSSAKLSPSKESVKATKTRKSNDVSKDLPQLVTHYGGCHCGAVRFSVMTSANLDVVDCNCSICTKKQNSHFIVPKARFKLTQGKDSLTTYTYNTHKAKHTFCKICGVQSFYTPRSNQDGYGIMPHCLDPGTVKSTKIFKFDGNQWENSIKHSSIAEYSKEPAKKKSRR